MKLVIGYGRNEEDWNSIRKLISEFGDITRNYEIVITRNKSELKNEIKDADIFFGFKLGRKLFQKANRLKWVHFSSAGVDHSLYREIIDSEVIITSAKGIHGTNIAEHVLTFLLYFSKSFDKLINKQKNHEWNKKEIVNSQFLIKNKKALILGFGTIGKEIARILKSNQIECFGVKKHITQKEIKNVKILKMEEARNILNKFDFVIDILPLTDETENIIDKDFFEDMKKGSIFVNVGRGEHVVKEALLNNTSHLRGVGLDVTPDEPLDKKSKLWDMENILITQHTSGDFQNYLEATTRLFLKNLKKFHQNEKLMNVVDKQKGY
ncbi:MAG: D-2-hydroxyacid dehydrogenase [Candidatus Mcinerneyibacterium aminivorans]|uniref:D-2-hydroxyacid dehydrogenase n=1 Tax=Candidatus Mcinerneyibacterium aminivorans TaxID=2703815 RepID=A0A5D0MEE0_9BACT|nr:MAG: D-2-hydroxyacid dehydrogenase [Candidatus Mcinerneyibacterium aminivorans]